MKNIFALFLLGANLYVTQGKIGKIIEKDKMSHGENMYTTYEKGPRFSIKFD